MNRKRTHRSRRKKHILWGEKIMCFGFMLFLVIGAALDGPVWWKAIIGVIISGVIMVVGRIIAILEGEEYV